MNIRPSRKNAAAFTLIELVISAALAAMILGAGYVCLSSAIATQKMIEPRVEILQNARVAMNLLSADLRSACPLSTDYDFLGTQRTIGDAEADNLDFATHNYTPQHPHEADFCEISYFLEQDPKTGQLVLWRRRNPTIAIDPLSGGSREEIARGLRGMRFEYYDGLDWYDSWGDLDGKIRRKGASKVEPNLSGMPEAVRITLSFDSNPPSKPVDPEMTGLPPKGPETNSPPLVFQTVTYLELAGINELRSAAASSSTNSAAPDASAGNNGGATQ